MNKRKVLDWLVSEADKQADDFYSWHYGVAWEDDLYELQGRRDEAPQLPRIPRSSKRALESVRHFFAENVTLVSLVMNQRFPDEFIYYRVSVLEPEIFRGFAFFSEIVPEWDFPFSAVGRKGMQRYLMVNSALLKFARAAWPRAESMHNRILYLLFEGFGKLFSERESYNRYWMIGSKEEYFESFEEDGAETTWSGKKEMRGGDIVFFYRMSPRKAVTDILRVESNAQFDPWGAWKGFWVDLKKLGPIPDITIGQMKNDAVLRQWSVVKRQFQGLVAEPIPHAVYNRLLDFIPIRLKRRYKLRPEQTGLADVSGLFVSEEDFEDRVIRPLLMRLGFKFRRQYPCRLRLGTQVHVGRVDFLVEDQRGMLTLFEDKFRITSDEDLQEAVEQAKSYALLLGLPSFVVAAPEGIWVYSLFRNLESLEEKLSINDLQDVQSQDELRSTLLRLRK